jgi:hypothetical protein
MSGKNYSLNSLELDPAIHFKFLASLQFLLFSQELPLVALTNHKN